MPSLVRLQWRRFALYLGIVKNMDSVRVLARTYCLIHLGLVPKASLLDSPNLVIRPAQESEGKQREESVNLRESAVKQRRTRRQCAKTHLKRIQCCMATARARHHRGRENLLLASWDRMQMRESRDIPGWACSA